MGKFTIGRGRQPGSGKFATRQELVDNVLRLRKSGLTYREVAEKCGVSDRCAAYIHQKPEMRFAET